VRYARSGDIYLAHRVCAESGPVVAVMPDGRANLPALASLPIDRQCRINMISVDEPVSEPHGDRQIGRYGAVSMWRAVVLSDNRFA
jgi:hypothetical protein